MFERFTDRARRVVVQAQIEARALRHDYIGTEHLLLGLIHEDGGLAVRVMRTLDVDPETVAGQLREVIGRGDETLPEGQHIPFTPRAKKTLELGLREALQMQHNYIGTEHLLLGLMSEGEGVAAAVLVNNGLDLDAARAQVKKLLGEYRTTKTARIATKLAPRGEPITQSEIAFQLRLISQRLAGIEARLGIEAAATHERLRHLEAAIASARQEKAAAVDEQDTERAARFRAQETQLMALRTQARLAWLKEEAEEARAALGDLPGQDLPGEDSGAE